VATTIYLDTSAAAKLFIAEVESPDLRQWFGSVAEPRLVSSVLLKVELIRLMRLIAPTAVQTAEQFIADRIDIVEITPPVIDDATTVPPARLRSLDALHLATALDLAESVDVVLTYDKVLVDAARSAGLAVAHPGATY
jgi:predicted nucleic acid-binding protein